MKKYIQDLLNTTIAATRSNDPHDIAGHFGIKVMLFPFGVLKGFILTVSNQTLIAVNSNLAKQEQRAVLAHELGHFFLSPRSYGYFYITSKTNLEIKIEREANLFAVALLSCGYVLEPDESLEVYSKRVGIPMELVPYMEYLLRK